MRASALPLVFIFSSLALSLSACSDDADEVQREAAPENDGIYGFVDGCYTMDAVAPGKAKAKFLAPADDGQGFAFSAADAASASRFTMRASDLATYLFYDEEEQYFVAEEGEFVRKAELSSDIFELDDAYLPGAQWQLEVSVHDETRFQLRHLKSGQYLTTGGLTESADEAAVVTLYPAEGCAEYPELTVDAEGEVTPRQFDDGSVWGIVETHSHILSNFGFGGAGIFHGSAFHPLGVEHALPSCEMFHAAEGRADLFGFGFDQGDDLDQDALLQGIVTGRTPEFNHHTEGYPEFTDWPSAHDSSTHQTQYYTWMKRAYLGGLRLMVQHATTNQIICELLAGSDTQPIRYSCNDMVAVDRIIEETRNLERYIDAQEGGPGKGWFRIVESPEEARQVINEGKMAIVLGIETSNLFDCFLTPPDGKERCTEQDVVEKLDEYYEKGVRVIFPVHKYDNGFSAGDGHRSIIELGNFIQTGHKSNFVEDCPDIPSVFDKGDVQFGGLNGPRDNYFADPLYDMSGFGDDPVGTLFDHVGMLNGGPLEGDYCMNAGLTPLGEFLIEELMKRGMVIEIDHLPRRSYERAFEMLETNDYPAVGSHGNNNNGKLYELGGVSKFNFKSCSDPSQPGTRDDNLQERIALIEAAGGYPAEGFGFDLNGFAGAPGPRFGDNSVCSEPQENPVTYPFDSFSGEVTFTEPRVGDRTIDFNTEGFAHIGMLPELIEDVRNDGVSDEDLDPLFRSAEGYLRMWEKSIERGEALGSAQ
ncbi:amidohydrolase family protein [Persicimonas caeni]|nr:membrane dipeptidase [Persicimonas caeni]